MKRAILAADDRLPGGPPPTPWPARHVLIDGAHLHVRDTAPTAPGAAPAVYVHGLGGSSQNWTDVAGLLADRLDGVAIDLPGFGYSDPIRRYTVPAFADRVIRWLDHADRGPVHLISASLGGAICVRVAALRPDLVRSLTLLSPAMPFLDPRRTSEGRMLPFLAVPRAHLFAARYMARLTPEQMATQALHDCFGDPARLCEQRRLEAIEEVRMRFTVSHYPQAYLATLRGLVGSFVRAYLPGSNSLWRLATRITVPTLIVGGTADRVIDTRVPSRVAQAIPDSRYLMLQGVGHLPQMEVPRLTARAIVGFLDELRVPSH